MNGICELNLAFLQHLTLNIKRLLVLLNHSFKYWADQFFKTRICNYKNVAKQYFDIY